MGLFPVLVLYFPDSGFTCINFTFNASLICTRVSMVKFSFPFTHRFTCCGLTSIFLAKSFCFHPYFNIFKAIFWEILCWVLFASHSLILFTVLETLYLKIFVCLLFLHAEEGEYSLLKLPFCFTLFRKTEIIAITIPPAKMPPNVSRLFKIKNSWKN